MEPSANTSCAGCIIGQVNGQSHQVLPHAAVPDLRPASTLHFIIVCTEIEVLVRLFALV